MGIEPKFDFKAINSYIDQKLELLETLIFRNLNYLGMRCVTLAKNLDTYVDRTGNLRNSIGYVIVKNGRVKYENFKAEKLGSGNSDEDSENNGVKIGKELAKEIASNFSEGYVLIVVAGMHYASYVEDLHHLDVLKPAEELAKSEIDQTAQDILNAMKKAL